MKGEIVHIAKIACPSCASQNTRSLGAIAPSNTFAGRMLENELAGGSLWQCFGCKLLFRYPRPGKEELNKLYQSGHTENWPAPVEKRTDWRLIRRWLRAQEGVRRVIDVGCFDGRLLEYLGRDYTWLGVEIHDEAAQRASARGVEVVSRDFANLSELNAGADVALAVDVIEHSLDPKIFLAALAANVRPGGYVVVATGNTSAPSWHLMGSQYWYCHIAEHLSFINPPWAEKIAPQLGLEAVYLRLFSHGEGAASFKKKIYEVAANLILRFTPRLFARLRRSGIGGIDLGKYPGLELAPPYWMTAKDHMLVVFKKRFPP